MPTYSFEHLATYSGGTTGAISFSYTDWLGSERVRTSASGAVTETCINLPFGDGQSCSGSDVSPLHFTGKQRDPETNLDEFPARYYASMQGRWMTPDWSARQEAVPYADIHDPQSLNLYRYAANNPASHFDSDGHIGMIGGILEWMGLLNPAQQSSQGSAQAQQSQVAVFSDEANGSPYQQKPGAAADRTVDYQAGKMDKSGHIDSHDIDRKATLTLHERLDPASKTKSVIIAKEPHSAKGVFKDYQYVPAGGEYRVVRDWKVNGNPAQVLDTVTHKAYGYEVVIYDSYAKPAIKTEYTNTPPF
jgi:RHS repeat-associated protein